MSSSQTLFETQVRETWLGPWDTIFVWLRFIHFALVPILIFGIHKDLRKKTEVLMCVCWRPNSVETKLGRPMSSYIYKKQQEWKKKQKKFKNVTHYT